MDIKVLGIDLAKDIFQLCGTDSGGNQILSKRLTRAKFKKFMCQLSPCLIGIEACGGSHYWHRWLSSQGHTVKMIAPQFVKPYVKSNKTDYNDAQAIAEAVTRPSMRFVEPKPIVRQDIQSLHRLRSSRVSDRTAISNQIRGLLSEYGIVLAKGINVLKRKFGEILEDGDNELSMLMREELNRLWQHFKSLDALVAHYDERLKEIARTNEVCKRLLQIPGFGVLTATIVYADIGNGSQFKNGREMAAYYGTVPRQVSSGNRQKLLGISKRGDRYIRTLLIHGGRTVVQHAPKKLDRLSQWINDKVARSHKNKAAVAVANKNVRVAWAMLKRNENYVPALPTLTTAS